MGPRATINLQVALPSDLMFTATRPSEWQLVGATAEGQRGEIKKDTKIRGSASIALNDGKTPRAGPLELESAVYYCEEEKGVCRSDGVVFKLEVKENASNDAVVATHEVTLPAKAKVGAA